jgi:tetratricopeptide (TPR) repeat protein
MTRILEAARQFDVHEDLRSLAFAVRRERKEAVPFVRSNFLFSLLRAEEVALGPAAEIVRREVLRRALLSLDSGSIVPSDRSGSLAETILRIRPPGDHRAEEAGLDAYLRWLEEIAEGEPDLREVADELRELHRPSRGEGYPYDALCVAEPSPRALRSGVRIRFRVGAHFPELDRVAFLPAARVDGLGERFREAHDHAARLAIRHRTDLRYPRIEVLGPGPPGSLEGGSVGLAAFVAISFAIHHRRPLPPVAAFVGSIDAEGRLRRAGGLAPKVEAAVEEGLALLFVAGEVSPEAGARFESARGKLIPLAEGSPVSEVLGKIENEISTRFPSWLEVDRRRLHAMVEVAEVDVRRGRSAECRKDLDFALGALDRLPPDEGHSRWARNLRVRCLNTLLRWDLHLEAPARQRDLYERMRQELDAGPPDPETLEIHLEAENRAAWIFIDAFDHAEARRRLLLNLKKKRQFARLIDLSLSLAKTRGSLGLLYLSMGRREPRSLAIALRHLRRALVAPLPEADRAYNETVAANVHYELGNLEEAESLYRAFLGRERRPDPGSYPRFYARWGLGRLLLRRAPEDPKGADLFFREAVRMVEESHAVAKEMLPRQRALASELEADLKWRLGERRAARKALDEAVMTIRYAHGSHPGHAELSYAARFLAKRSAMDAEDGLAKPARESLTEAIALLDGLEGEPARRWFSGALGDLRRLLTRLVDRAVWPAAVRRIATDM